MCGIVGILNLNDSPVSQFDLNQFTDSLSHRGPDDRGIYIDKEGFLGLGHRRLAILDLTGFGRQPMSYANRYWITYNGEIYNFIELRKELFSSGYKFQTESDTEVIMAAYDKWGIECQLRFNGMWAFAIWDIKERELFISRDRFGVKPLLYYYDQRCFVFASEMKAFLSLQWFQRDFDYNTVLKEIRTPVKVEGTEHCLLKGVKRLKAGYCLNIKDKKLKFFRWWNTLNFLESINYSFPKQIEKFKELFFDACKIRMRSDVSVGTSLSGGLDSSSVLCTMSAIRNQSNSGERQSPEWQKAFIATYPGTFQDETVYAEKIVKYVKCQGIFEEINPDNILENIDDIIFNFEEISGDLPLGPWCVYKRMRQDGVYVSLDGHGGDELLGGYHHHLNWTMRDTLWPIPQPLRLLNLRRILRNMYFDKAKVEMPNLRYLWNRRLLQAKPENYSELISDQPLMKGFDSLNKGLYSDFHFTQLPTNLRDFDRLSMAHGIEVRAPFMDWRVVCYGFSLLAKSKIGGVGTKRILREAMKGVLPEEIRTRTTKVGFSSPQSIWIKSSLKPFIMDEVNSRHFSESVFWESKKIRKIIEDGYAKEDWNEISRYLRYLYASRLLYLFKKK